MKSPEFNSFLPESMQPILLESKYTIKILYHSMIQDLKKHQETGYDLFDIFLDTVNTTLSQSTHNSGRKQVIKVRRKILLFIHHS